MPSWFDLVATALLGWLGGVVTMMLATSRWIRHVENAAVARAAAVEGRVLVLEQIVGETEVVGMRGELRVAMEKQHADLRRVFRALIRLGAANNVDLADIFDD
jgi:hypothetical protein